MKNLLHKIVVMGLLGSLLSGCLTNQAGELDKQSVVGLTGAVAGGVIGSQMGKGVGNTAAIIGGSMLGGILGSEVGKSLDKADIAYQNRTQHKALEHNKTGASSSWKNPDSGASGVITPTRTFNRDGTYCREFSQTINVGGKSERAYGTACRQPDGSWEIVGN